MDDSQAIVPSGPRKVEPPGAISKSLRKSMGCPHYFAHHYMLDPPPPQPASPLGEAGTEFHAYRADLIQHLLRTGRISDPDYGLEWLANRGTSELAAELIRHDSFTLNPDHVLATELFLSVDDRFRALEYEPGNSTPGRLSETGYLSGTLDLVLQPSDNELELRDSKSGWNTSTADEFDAAVYAVLAFGHFPEIETVTFTWEFVRSRSTKERRYTQGDLDWLHPMIHAAQNRKRNIRDEWMAGSTLDANPEAGLCGFCKVDCPQLQQAVALVMDPHRQPLRTREDRVQRATLLYVLEQKTPELRAELKRELEAHGDEDLGSDVRATIVHGHTGEYPATPEVLEICDRYDVPRNGLGFSRSKVERWAKAKKRSGMSEELAPHEIRKPSNRLAFCRVDPAKQVEATP